MIIKKIPLNKFVSSKSIHENVSILFEVPRWYPEYEDIFFQISAVHIMDYLVKCSAYHKIEECREKFSLLVSTTRDFRIIEIEKGNPELSKYSPKEGYFGDVKIDPEHTITRYEPGEVRKLESCYTNLPEALEMYSHLLPGITTEQIR